MKNEATKRYKPKKLTKNVLQLYSLCLIPLLLVFVFNYIPMFGIIIAFKNYRYDRGIFGSEWIGFKNFEYFIRSNDFWRITQNTLVLNTIFIVVGIVLSVALAIMLFDVKKTRNVKIYQTIVITPTFLSWVVAGYMAYAILNPEYGLINTLIKNLGLETVSWYTTPKAWPTILTIASVWKNVGMDSVVYYAALMGIDSELYEAAQIEGANKWQLIKKISIPSLIPLISMLSILKIGTIFRADFGLFYQLTRDVGVLYPTTDVVDTYIFRTMRVIGDMSMSSAVGVLQSVVGFVLVMITNYGAKKIDPDRALF